MWLAASPSSLKPTPRERAGGDSSSTAQQQMGPVGSGLVSDSCQNPLPAFSAAWEEAERDHAPLPELPKNPLALYLPPPSHRFPTLPSEGKLVTAHASRQLLSRFLGRHLVLSSLAGSGVSQWLTGSQTPLCGSGPGRQSLPAQFLGHFSSSTLLVSSSFYEMKDGTVESLLNFSVGLGLSLSSMSGKWEAECVARGR